MMNNPLGAAPPERIELGGEPMPMTPAEFGGNEHGRRFKLADQGGADQCPESRLQLVRRFARRRAGTDQKSQKRTSLLALGANGSTRHSRSR
jgi:hypothetical protein